MITVDFETLQIEARPKYPPEPVGVAIKWNESRADYYAWGHPSGNNSTRAEAAALLESAWQSGEALIFHNAKFDMDVAETRFGLPRLPWDRVHDTMFLAFLADPHSAAISLKPLAERYLGLPPAERDEVYEWLRVHGVITAAQKSPGAFIAQCDGEVVGRTPGEIWVSPRTVGSLRQASPSASPGRFMPTPSRRTRAASDCPRGCSLPEARFQFPTLVGKHLPISVIQFSR